MEHIEESAQAYINFYDQFFYGVTSTETLHGVRRLQAKYRDETPENSRDITLTVVGESKSGTPY